MKISSGLSKLCCSYSNLERALFHVNKYRCNFRAKNFVYKSKPIYYHSPGHRGQQKGVRQALRNL